MSEQLYLLTIFLPLGTILLVFGMKYFTSLQEARARLAEAHAYRQMMEKSTAAQTQTAASLEAIQGSLADLTARMIAVEKMLKDVG